MPAPDDEPIVLDDTEEIGDRCPYCGKPDHYCSLY
jgi:hypothetical protein